MGFFKRFTSAFADEDERGLASDGRNLRLVSAYNLRELGGYKTALGKTRYGHMLRGGGTRTITGGDKRWLIESYHLTHVLDLRGSNEGPETTDVFAHTPGVNWHNSSLLDYDLSHPVLEPVDTTDNYLVNGYLHMLMNAERVRDIMAFLASVPTDECVMFHCAAGMDRTGMTALLVLGNACASRETIVADYCYSFGPVSAVDAMVRGERQESSVGGLFGLDVRREAVETVYDALVDQHGSVRNYLLACEVPEEHLNTLNEHLLS